MELEAIIGLETHVQLKTKSKMFCSCDNESNESKPNTNICPICLAHPGTLPVANQEAIKYGLKAALMLGCKINLLSKFDRKNYFYPDLPKSYQISQFDLPLGYEGRVTFYNNGQAETIRIERLHLEEDAAKSRHPAKTNFSLIDYNRGGTPLAEIVTHPDFRSPQSAKAYLQELRLIMKYLDVSDADMEKGHLRCDANISLRPKGEDKLYPKTEIKNLNSFRAVEKALDHEIKRQTKLWRENKPILESTTRGWDENTESTYEQRSKEASHDYRYFPEPDLPPLEFKNNSHAHGHTCKEITTDEINLDCLKSDLPEKPKDKIDRFMAEYAFSFADAKTLAEDQLTAAFAENTISELRAWLNDNADTLAIDEDEMAKKKIGKLVGGWITSEIFKSLNAKNKRINDIKMQPPAFAALLGLVITNRVNKTTGKNMLAKLIDTTQMPEELLTSENIIMLDNTNELTEIIKKIINDNPKVIADFKKGKENSIQFLIGQVMRATKGMTDPEKATEIIKKELA